MADNEFDMTEESGDGFSKFFVKGRITSISANVLQHNLGEAFSKGKTKVIVNMMQVNFLSSAGIRVLLMFYKKAKAEGGSFHIEEPSENVINVLGMTALDEMLLK